MRANRVKELLRRDEPAIGGWVNVASLIGAEMFAYAGFDWLVVDAQHGVMDLETLQAMLIAIGSTPCVPLARVAGLDPLTIGRVLDAGAYGVVVPNVDTAEQARAVVRACRYAPEGARSVGPIRSLYWAGADYLEHANAEILVVVQVESAEALRNVDAILAVPGVDVCYIGPYDLARSLGVQPGSEPHEAAIADILAACRRRGIAAGIWGVDGADTARRLAQGFRVVNVTNDVSLLQQSAQRELALARAWQPG